MQLTRFFLYAVVLLIPIGQFSRLPFGGVSIYGLEIMIGLCVLTGLLLGLVRTVPRYLWFLYLFVAIAFISLVWGSQHLSAQETLVSGLYWVRFIFYVLLASTVAVVVQNQRSLLIRLMLYSAGLLSVAGYIQLFIFPDLGLLDPSLGWDPHLHRLTSTFFDPNFLGGYFVLAMIMVASLWLTKDSAVSRRTLFFLMLLIFPAFILTFSRSAYLMFAIAMFILGVLVSKRLLLLALLAFLVAALLVPRVQTRIAGGVDPDDSARARFASWQLTGEIIKKSPLLGVGFNSYRYAQERYGFFDYTQPQGGRSGAGADSSILFVWATTGIMGLTVYLLFFADLFLHAYSQWKRHQSAVSLMIIVSISGLFVQSQFINALFYPWIMAWFFILVGLYGTMHYEK